MNSFDTIPADAVITQTAQALTANGFTTIIASSDEEAKLQALQLIPEGREVMTMTSETLRTLGIDEHINMSGKYNALRPTLNSMDRSTQGKEMRKLGSVPDIAIGSVHAITLDGHVLIASRTGSQLPAYVYGAKKVIWVVGAQKIVKNIDEGKKRIFDYVLGLESQRANKAYNITTGSRVNRLLEFYAEEIPHRITIILVKKSLGF